jgi:CubicO group peptidase (beta-lactamase class C family)
MARVVGSRALAHLEGAPTAMGRTVTESGQPVLDALVRPGAVVTAFVPQRGMAGGAYRWRRRLAMPQASASERRRGGDGMAATEGGHERTATPEGLESGLGRLSLLLEEWCAAHDTFGATLHVARWGQLLLERGYGRIWTLSSEGARPRPAAPRTIYLVASLTKPLTAAAAMLLVERRQLLLDDPVCRILPEFTGGGRDAVRLRHLLTHTSGLPDMLPQNESLRARHAPLADFLAGTCHTPLLFSPGSDCRYQSMGMLLLGAIVERVTGSALATFLEREFLLPLAMGDTWLGMGPLRPERLARVNIREEEKGTDWHWNSPYWRGLGAPWGGLQTTARDYAHFLQTFLEGGRGPVRQVLASGTVSAMLTDQVAALPDVPPAVKAAQAWGLGWRLNQPLGAEHLPDRGSPRAFGHLGATGTMAWADPESGLSCVLLSTEPRLGRLRSLVSNAVAALAG